MTTTKAPVPRTDAASSTISRALWYTFVVAAVITAVMAGIGRLFQDGTAGYSALIAGALVLVVFGPGLLIVKAVSRISPSATMVIALLTYVLQLIAILFILWRLQALDWGHGQIDPAWLGGTLILIALGSVGALITVSLRARIPAYDERAAGTTSPSDRTQSQASKGGAW